MGLFVRIAQLDHHGTRDSSEGGDLVKAPDRPWFLGAGLGSRFERRIKPAVEHDSNEEKGDEVLDTGSHDHAKHEIVNAGVDQWIDDPLGHPEVRLVHIGSKVGPCLMKNQMPIGKNIQTLEHS